MRRQDVTSSVSQTGPVRGGPDGPLGPPAERSEAQSEAPSDIPSSAGAPPAAPVSASTVGPASPPVPPGEAAGVAVPAASPSPRWLVVLAWSTGPAGVYALASLAHAAFVERILSVEVGFGRSLAFWIGAIYLALLAWGFLPRRPSGWYARRRPIVGALALGLAGVVVCGAFTGLWLVGHWVPAIGVPVTVSIVVLLVAAVGVLWLARGDR